MTSDLTKDTTRPAVGATAPAAAIQPPPKPKASGVRAPGEWRILPARLGICIITDDDQFTRVFKGEHIPKEERKTRWAIPGEIATDIPAASLPGMIEGPEPWVCKANGPDDPYTLAFEEKAPAAAAFAWARALIGAAEFYTLYGRPLPEWLVKGQAAHAARVKARESATAAGGE